MQAGSRSKLTLQPHFSQEVETGDFLRFRSPQANLTQGPMCGHARRGGTHRPSPKEGRCGLKITDFSFPNFIFFVSHEKFGIHFQKTLVFLFAVVPNFLHSCPYPSKPPKISSFSPLLSLGPSEREGGFLAVSEHFPKPLKSQKSGGGIRFNCLCKCRCILQNRISRTYFCVQK